MRLIQVASYSTDGEISKLRWVESVPESGKGLKFIKNVAEKTFLQNILFGDTTGFTFHVTLSWR